LSLDRDDDTTRERLEQIFEESLDPELVFWYSDVGLEDQAMWSPSRTSVEPDHCEECDGEPALGVPRLP
jgi:hypothetical protein